MADSRSYVLFPGIEVTCELVAEGMWVARSQNPTATGRELAMAQGAISWTPGGAIESLAAYLGWRQTLVLHRGS